MKSIQPTLLVSIQFSILLILLLSLVFIPAPLKAISALLGGLISLSGVIITLLAIHEHVHTTRQIPNISPKPKTHSQLITSGLYKYIRHPIYTGVITTSTGAGIAHGNPIPIIIALSLIPFFYYKSALEERWLEQLHPEYKAYKKATGRFLPHLPHNPNQQIR